MLSKLILLYISKDFFPIKENFENQEMALLYNTIIDVSIISSACIEWTVKKMLTGSYVYIYALRDDLSQVLIELVIVFPLNCKEKKKKNVFGKT